MTKVEVRCKNCSRSEFEVEKVKNEEGEVTAFNTECTYCGKSETHEV